MRIVFLNVTYKQGSTGNIVGMLFDRCTVDGMDAYYLFGRGKTRICKNNHVIKVGFEFESKIHHFFSLFTGNIYGGSFFGTAKAIRQIKKIQPDLVHIHCINGYFISVYKLINFLKKKKIKTIVTNHADFLFTANCGIAINCDGWKTGCLVCSHFRQNVAKSGLKLTHHYFLKMKAAFLNFQQLQFTCVSPWLTSRAKVSLIERDFKINTIPNAIEDHPSKGISLNLLPKNQKNILFVCPDFENQLKGGHFLFDLEKMHYSDDVFFYVIGRASKYRDTKKIFFLGQKSHDQIDLYYQNADLTLLLSQVETFSMVMAESLCAGTPLAGFFSGGPESVIKNSPLEPFVRFVPYGSLSSLNQEIEKIVTLKKNGLACEISSLARDFFSPEKMYLSYKALYQETLASESKTHLKNHEK